MVFTVVMVMSLWCLQFSGRCPSGVYSCLGEVLVVFTIVRLMPRSLGLKRPKKGSVTFIQKSPITVVSEMSRWWLQFSDGCPGAVNCYQEDDLVLFSVCSCQLDILVLFAVVRVMAWCLQLSGSG